MRTLFEPNAPVQSRLNLSPPPRPPQQLTEKYRPSTLAEVFGQGAIVAQLRTFMLNPYPTAFLFAGPTGTGKSSVGHALARDLKVDLAANFFHIKSGSQDAEAIEEIGRVLRFVPWGGGWRLILVDEADQWTPKAKQLWLSILEEIPANTVVVFTTNHPEKFDQRTLDRMQRFDFASDDLTGAQQLVDTLWQAETGGEDGPDLGKLGNLVVDGALSFRRVVSAVQAFIRGEMIREAAVAAPRLCGGAPVESPVPPVQDAPEAKPEPPVDPPIVFTVEGLLMSARDFGRTAQQRVDCYEAAAALCVKHCSGLNGASERITHGLRCARAQYDRDVEQLTIERNDREAVDAADAVENGIASWLSDKPVTPPEEVFEVVPDWAPPSVPEAVMIGGIGGKPVPYKVEVIRLEERDRHIRVSKAYRGGSVYDVEEHNGQVSCNCPDFACRHAELEGQSRGCKHVRKLRDLGILSPWQVPTVVIPPVAGGAPEAESEAPWTEVFEVEPEPTPVIMAPVEPKEQPRMTLADLAETEAKRYDAWNSEAGALFARTMRDLAECIRSTGADNAEDFDARRELLERWNDEARAHAAFGEGW